MFFFYCPVDSITHESMLLNLYKPLRNWTFQHFARAAQKKGRNGTNKKI